MKKGSNSRRESQRSSRSGVGDGELHVVSPRPRTPSPGDSLEGHVARLDRQRPPSGIASRALTARLTITCSIVRGRPAPAETVAPNQPERNVLADQTMQHLAHVGDDIVEIRMRGSRPDAG